MSKRYTDSCFLSKAQDKRNSNSPDYFGQVEFSEETIRYLAQQLREGEPKLRVALWRKENDRGVYLSMQLSVPQERGEGRQAQRRSSSERRSARRVEPREMDDDQLDDEIPF